MHLPPIVIDQPDWLENFANKAPACPTDGAKMDLVIALARKNMEQGTGLPFGAAVFDRRTELPVGLGVNLVGKCNNSILHAETMAIMSAQAGLEGCHLGEEEGRRYELAASSEPCAMCLGAAWYAGLRRVVHGTLGPDIKPFGFGLGPGLGDLAGFFDGSGFEIKGGVRREEALGLFSGPGSGID
jgi:tRNA(Arg) A34 adenosine deaminase TadA